MNLETIISSVNPERMNLTFDSVKIIYGPNKKKLLEIPLNTLLDNIFNDLWADIIKYTNYHLYMISTDPNDCPGYRTIKTNEFNKTIFFKYYFKNEGIHTNTAYPCGPFLIGNCNLTISNHIIKCSRANNKIKFYTFSSYIDIKSINHITLKELSNDDLINNKTYFHLMVPIFI